ncbi:TldD/PmbA family protein [Oceanirhabdus sp. W0125-5]|uniref:TldD/PmbA family protein n=1 Tax=Oceanirhabdus sp. W0125-5 TaxID=2999116 RepID=UPI0022F307BA|nr:TldD/PmbA family protein [Oceanirhabdus sp. W0125-5]WBW95621.1 TldD/PmbA family protein [Oceanirhabdus sp. W0125-5]
MPVKISEFLVNKKPLIKKLIDMLSDTYEYVSVLGTDCRGKEYQVSKTGVSVNDSFLGERGFVLRIHNGVNYSEYSFNEIHENNLNTIIEDIQAKLNKTSRDISMNSYKVINEDEIEGSYFGEIIVNPDEVSAEEILKVLTDIKDEALAYSDMIANFSAKYSAVKISKVFMSNKKNLEQAYMISEGGLFSLARKDDNTKYYYKGFSGLKGIELLDEMKEAFKLVVDESINLLDAKPVEPGEYEVICSPEISGLIAHEAFGHGVEMDMFVKDRAKGAEYIDKQVASTLTTMHDGAAAAKHMSSYYFDDEGTLGTDTVIINNGILKTGISDLLSAMKLGTKPTGNGKRESFERKAYARMTNTFFESGKDKVEDMIASIKHGYLLETVMSGMEDPKNWGIQCIALLGREIKDGKLTGELISPVIMTGYVPDLLNSISMVSDEVRLEGSGFCGKGYKELVKVSDGGPYIKAKVRLG